MMDWGENGWSWWWMLPMMMFMVLLVGAALWALLAITRSDATRAQPRRPSGEDILNERFARGEIDESDYRNRLDALHRASS